MTVSYIVSLYNVYRDYFEKNEIELIIVDNASADGAANFITQEVAGQHYRNIHIIKNVTNDGFAKACNKGASHAKGEFLLFLNNDSLIKSEGFLKMVSFMQEHPHVAVMGGRMKNTDGSPQLSAWKFYTLPNALIMLLGMERFGLLQSSPNTIQKVDWVTGGCMMVQRKIFSTLGGFDEHFFMYMEDMELCYRVTKAKYAIYYYPFLNINHIGQGSSNRSFAIINIYKGILYFYKKHMPAWQYGIIKAILYLKAKLLIIFGKISHRTYFSSTYEQALAVFQ